MVDPVEFWINKAQVRIFIAFPISRSQKKTRTAIMPLAFLNLGQVRLQAHFNSERLLGLLFAILGFFRFVFFATITGTSKYRGCGEGYDYCCTNDEVFHMNLDVRSSDCKVK